MRPRRCSSASAIEAAFDGPRGLALDVQPWFRASGVGGDLTVTTGLEPVLDAADVRTAQTCTQTWAANTDWQALCTPGLGQIGHVRLQDVQTTGNNAYWYVVAGESAANPTGAPATGPGKLIVTGGQANSGASWTWFRFDDEQSALLELPSPGAPDALYTSGATDVCFDLAPDPTDDALQLLFWATGQDGADCGDRTTLTVGNALYDSSTDPNAATLWAESLASGSAWVKTSSGAVTIGTVTVDARAAVLD